ncbi:hypothetical protein [Spiroplasma taiwanense]|uniref:Uncharacterized protein n=1 Tax=Spiroplasma taiwanense CT-1 TaxID=1276220 RepID=S5LTY0_9MOLU|nr:hypothetical protein [Spiroplasma taiwanense]AGR41169.1 hypothetical protein STAIW_v1c05440 [Spiroplasma taiwanense CT-1]
MALDLNNLVEINNGDFNEISQQLNNGKTVLAALEKGPLLEEALKTGKMNDGFANIKFKEEKDNCGVCGCGKPANTLVYLYR